MTATDELRRLLDERGVEHYDGTECTLWGYEDYNEFTGIYRFSADETSDGHMQVRLWYVTPEQAIDATLGSGTCHYEIAFFGDGKAWFACSECGGMASADYDPPKYCPHCGRKVVDE